MNQYLKLTRMFQYVYNLVYFSLAYGHFGYFFINRSIRVSTEFPWFLVQLLSHFQLPATPWPAAHQSSLSFTISQSLLKLTSIEMVMLSNHLILCHPLLLLPPTFPSIRKVSSESALHIRWPKLFEPSASVFPVNIQGWFPLGLTGLISLISYIHAFFSLFSFL